MHYLAATVLLEGSKALALLKLAHPVFSSAFKEALLYFHEAMLTSEEQDCNDIEGRLLVFRRGVQQLGGAES